MRTIKLETMYEYNDGSKTKILAKPPSKSFLAQARIALTKWLSGCIEDPLYQTHLTEYFEVSINWGWFWRHTEKELMLPLKFGPKNSPLVLLEIYLVWKFRQPDCEQVPYPWLDYVDGELCFQVIADSVDIKHMNMEIPMVVAPVIRKKESGLPYDYQVKAFSTDGTVQISFQESVTEKELKAVESIQNQFFTEYNENHEEKVHNIEPPKIFHANSVRFDVDFADTPMAAIIELIRSFQTIEGIKKIVFQ